MAKNWLINVSGRSAKKWLAYEVNIIIFWHVLLTTGYIYFLDVFI